MTIWRVGQLAVCAVGGPWFDHPTGEAIVGPDIGDVSLVTKVYVDHEDDLMIVLLDYPDPKGYLASEFRPAVQDGLSEKSTKRVTLDDLIPVSA